MSISINKNRKNPLCKAERVVERSKDRVSQLCNWHCDDLTNPDIVTLVDPLFAVRKEDEKRKGLKDY